MIELRNRKVPQAEALRRRKFKKATLLMPLLRDLLRQIQSQQMQLEHF